MLQSGQLQLFPTLILPKLVLNKGSISTWFYEYGNSFNKRLDNSVSSAWSKCHLQVVYLSLWCVNAFYWRLKNNGTSRCSGSAIAYPSYPKTTQSSAKPAPTWVWFNILPNRLLNFFLWMFSHEMLCSALAVMLQLVTQQTVEWKYPKLKP